jgi:hypothetical protein
MTDKNTLAITEEMNIQDKWYEDARHMTLEKLPEFLDKLAFEYQHDYGTICHAIAASAIAASWAMNDTEQGGITGFQAGAIMWEYIRHWQHFKGPMRLVTYSDMLYPQHEDRFTKTISSNTWEYLQKEAAEKLKEQEIVGNQCSERVLAHWQSIVDGNIPFGFELEQEDD